MALMDVEAITVVLIIKDLHMSYDEIPALRCLSVL
jgi:hypothetical protein